MNQIDVHNLQAGKLFINNTDITQVIFVKTDSYRIKPKGAIIVDGRGVPSDVNSSDFVEAAKKSSAILPVDSNKPDPLVFFHPDTYRLKDAFQFAAKHKGKFSVLIIRDNSSYITPAGTIGGFGDVIMASVIAKALKYNYGSNVTVYMKVMPRGAEILKNNPYVDKIIIDQKDADELKPDIKFSVNDLEFKVEMHDIERGNKIRRNRASIYLSLLDLPLENKTPAYIVTEEEKSWGKAELKKKGYSLRKPIIAVQLKGSNVSRTWDHTEDLITELRKKYQVFILDEQKDGIFSYSIRQVASILYHCAVVVTPNSFYFHLSGAMRKRCITLFGSVDSAIWVEDYEKTLALEGHCPYSDKKCWWQLTCLPGSNMYEKELSHTPECLSDISVEQVTKAVEKQLHPRKIAILLLTYNCLEYTKKAIDSIRSFHDYEIFVADNNSTDGTQEWLKEQGIKFISKKMSVTEAQNEGIRFAKKSMNFDYLFLLNNDVILSSTYLDSLVETIERRKCAAVTGKVIESSECTEQEFQYKVLQAETPVTAMIAGDLSAILFSKATLEKIGAFDESFFPRYQEDECYLLRIRLAGGEIIRTYATTFYHRLGTTLSNHPEASKKRDADWIRNVEVFKKKYGFDPYSERHLYSDLPAIKGRCPDWKSKIYIPLER